jgi:hypothetical protein
MTHLPGEGTSPTPQPDPEEVIRSLEDRLIVIAGEMGRLATEMTDITAELAARRAAMSGDQNTTDEVAVSAAPQIVELYSRLEDDASRPSEEFERISALNAEFPQRIQDIFAPTLSVFSADIPTRVNPSDDRTLKGKKLRRRPPTALPDYSEDPKKWQKMVNRHAQHHEWREDNQQGAFHSLFTLDYVKLANGDRELVGYGFGLDGKEYLQFGNIETRGLLAKIVCADNLVRTAAFKYHRKHTKEVYQHHPETTTYNFHDNTIEVRGGYENKKVFSTHSYTPEEYRYEQQPYGGELLPADEVLTRLQDYMATIPTRKPS